MTLEEKRAWILAAVAAAGYAIYLIVILGRAGGAPLPQVPYVAPLLWCVGGGIVAGIVLGIAAGMSGTRVKDQRDREIGRLGDHIGQSFLIIGAIAALLMSLAEFDYFWISNAIYLAFVLSALLGSVAKIFAYRRGFQEW